MPTYRIAQAERILAMSNDTIRRYIDMGKLPASRDSSNRIVIDGRDLARFSREHTHAATDHSAGQASARNVLVGLVTVVEFDDVMARVEVQAGPHRVVSLMSAEAAGELGLRAGVLAVTRIKATDVLVELPVTR